MLSKQEEMIFSIHHSGERPYEYDDRVHWVSSYEMNLNQYEIERKVYSGLDWIGDMGGLLDGLYAICILILGVVNFRLYETYMIS